MLGPEGKILLEEYTYLCSIEIDEVKRLDTEIAKLQEERMSHLKLQHTYEHNIEKLEGDAWRAEAMMEQHVIQKWGDLPKNIIEEYSKIVDDVKGGCHGDPYDGCRGCTHRCETRARELFMEKYNITKITH